MMNDNSNQTSIPSANTMWLCITSSCVKLMNLCNIIEVYSPTCPAGSTCQLKADVSKPQKEVISVICTKGKR